jgi:hypothetical protein
MKLAKFKKSLSGCFTEHVPNQSSIIPVENHVEPVRPKLVLLTEDLLPFLGCLGLFVGLAYLLGPFYSSLSSVT